jgi:hypothetical protein
MYVKRDANGQIEAVSQRGGGGWEESVAADSPELSAFFGENGRNGAQGRLASTDLELVRVLEDLIDVLVKKEVIFFTDLPEAAQKKLLERRHTRVHLREGLNLLDFDDEGGAV